jgi:hypothetical protein
MTQGSPKLKKLSAKQERAQRRTNLARSIDLAWESLRTHLADAAHTKKRKREARAKTNERWEASCVREYAEIIHTAAVELHELTKIDFPDKHESMNEPI